MSESARQKLAPHLAGQCEFLPVEVVNLSRELGISGFDYYSAITEPAFRPGRGQV